MASIYGIALKNIKTGPGREGTMLIGSVYLDGKRIGQYCDYADGGCGYFEGDTGKLTERINQYFREHPRTDVMRLFDMSSLTPQEYAQMKENGTLPTTNEGTLDDFINDLYNLTMTEKNWKKATKKGYQCLVTIRFPYIPRSPRQKDYDCQCLDETDIIDKIRKEAKAESPASIVTIYRTEQDFVIRHSIPA